MSHSIFSRIKLIHFAFGLVALLAPAFSCNQKPKSEITSLPVDSPATVKVKYTAAMVDNKKDPSCGMPVTAGIEDTAHYGGKVYGFCSDECKQKFLNDPKTLAKNADMK